jgi:hypothetical protein
MKLFALLLTILLFAIPTLADDQAGLALDFLAKKATLGVRFMNNGADLGATIPTFKHQALVLDFETDRSAGQTTMSPAVGWQFNTTYKRLTPYAYFNVGDTTTIHQGTVFNSTIGQGLDVRLTSRYGLRFEHEFDWSKQMANQWDQRYTVLFVVHFGKK